jgi:hypothetical protein
MKKFNFDIQTKQKPILRFFFIYLNLKFLNQKRNIQKKYYTVNLGFEIRTFGLFIDHPCFIIVIVYLYIAILNKLIQ